MSPAKAEANMLLSAKAEAEHRYGGFWHRAGRREGCLRAITTDDSIDDRLARPHNVRWSSERLAPYGLRQIPENMDPAAGQSSPTSLDVVGGTLHGDGISHP